MEAELLFLLTALLTAIPIAYLLGNTWLARRYTREPPSPPAQTNEITILVPVHGQDPDLFRRCIASVAAQGSRFLVIGDRCNEPYRSITEQFGGEFWGLPEQSGKKAALGYGISRVSTPLVLLVDSDTGLPPDAARDLSAHLGGGVGGVGANLVVATTGRPVGYCAEFVERAREVVLRAMSTHGSVLYLDGACALYRTELIRSYVLSAEFQDLRVLGRPSPLGDDWMLTDCLLHQGYRTVKAYETRVTIQPKATFSEFVAQNVRWSRSNWIRFGRYLRRGTPRSAGRLYRMEVFATYALPLVGLSTALLRLRLLIGRLLVPSLTLGEALRAVVSTVLFLPPDWLVGLPRLGLTFLECIAAGVFVAAVMRAVDCERSRFLFYGAVATGVLFVTAVYGLFTFWKRPVWAPGTRPAPAGASRSETGA